MVNTQRIGNQTLAQGDCLDLMKRLPSQTFDVVVTSPPYNLGIKYDGGQSDDRAEGAYVEWMLDVLSEIRRTLRTDGSLFLNLAGSSKNPYLPFEVMSKARGLLHLQNTIHWIKALDERGHFKPVTGNRYLHRAHEYIFHLTHTGDVQLDRLSIGIPYADKSNIARRGHEQDLRCRGNTWFIPYETVQSSKGSHPAAFPVELAERCIKLHGKARPIVLDPFMGSGSTLVACARLGARGIGMDLSSGYVALAAERLTPVSRP